MSGPSTLTALHETLEQMGSDVTFHREDAGTPCPCRTPEGFRDINWHRIHPEPIDYAAPIVAEAPPANYGLVVIVTPTPPYEVQNRPIAAVDDADFFTQVGLSPTDVIEWYNVNSVKIYTLNHQGYFTYFGESAPLYEPPEDVVDSQFVHPAPPLCNEQGFQSIILASVVTKASIQPAVSGLYRTGQRANALLGDVLRGDKIGIFPCAWAGVTIDFDNWSTAGEDYILYDGDRYIAVSADKLPDTDGNPNHHWEVGLRLARTARVTL